MKPQINRRGPSSRIFQQVLDIHVCDYHKQRRSCCSGAQKVRSLGNLYSGYASTPASRNSKPPSTSLDVVTFIHAYLLSRLCTCRLNTTLSLSCIYVCMCVRMYVYIHIIYITCIQMHMHIHMHIHLHLHLQVHIHMHIHPHLHICICRYLCI